MLAAALAGSFPPSEMLIVSTSDRDHEICRTVTDRTSSSWPTPDPLAGSGTIWYRRAQQRGDAISSVYLRNLPTMRWVDACIGCAVLPPGSDVVAAPLVLVLVIRQAGRTLTLAARICFLSEPRTESEVLAVARVALFDCNRSAAACS